MTEKPSFRAEPPTQPGTIEAQLKAIRASQRRTERTVADVLEMQRRLYDAITTRDYTAAQERDQLMRRLNALELPGSGKR